MVKRLLSIVAVVACSMRLLQIVFLPLPSCPLCFLLLLILSFFSFVNITRSKMKFGILFFCRGGIGELFERCGVLVGVAVGFNRCCVRF